MSVDATESCDLSVEIELKIKGYCTFGRKIFLLIMDLFVLEFVVYEEWQMIILNLFEGISFITLEISGSMIVVTIPLCSVKKE